MSGESPSDGGPSLAYSGAKVCRNQAVERVLLFGCGGDAGARWRRAPPSAEETTFGVGVGFHSGNQIEIVPDGSLVGADLGPLVTDQTYAFGGREAGFNMPRPAPRKRWWIERCGSNLCHRRWQKRARLRNLQGSGVGRKNCAVLFVDCCFEANGERPFLRGIGLNAGTQIEALLRNLNPAVRRLAKGQQRHAGLGYEAIHDFVDGLVAGGGLRVPEVFGCGVGVQVRGEVIVYAFAECFGADVVFDAEQNVARPCHRRCRRTSGSISVGSVGFGADGAGSWLRVQIQRAVQSPATT